MSSENLQPPKTGYPVRIACGIAQRYHDQLFLDESISGQRRILSNSAAVCFLYCEGNHTFSEVLLQICAEFNTEQSTLVQEISTCLEGLCELSLIRFAKRPSRPTPLVPVSFLNFWPEFTPENNYFGKMLAQNTCVILSKSETAQILFHSAMESGPRNIDRAIKCIDPDCFNVLVTDKQPCTEFGKFDFVFSPGPVGADEAGFHCQLLPEEYIASPPYYFDPGKSQQFHQALFGENEIAIAERDADIDSPDRRCMDTDKVFDVCFSTDKNQSVGLFALINSIVKNTNNPDCLFFHILVDADREFYVDIIDTQLSCKIRYEVIEFSQTENFDRNFRFLRENMRVQGGARDETRIDNLMNFARFYIPEIFPNIRVGLYLDVDMIAQGNLAAVFETDLSGYIAAAPLNRSLKNFNFDVKLGITGKGFNAGFLLINFELWRQQNILGKIETIMRKHRQNVSNFGGTQPIINQALHGHCLNLNHLWNVSNLGYRENLDSVLLQSAWVLHWNGSAKPWLDTGFYKELWENYRVNIKVKKNS